LLQPNLIINILAADCYLVLRRALLQQAAAMAFGSDLQAAMAFSGILVVIMVAIFPGLLKLET
jgi:hypothetical protein